ncbi:MAG: GMC family oxidoreductase [Alphaproteobacteria bacterium]|nr:GMC family oxidoreductase [Alphaproteobacteria bacterium]
MAGEVREFDVIVIGSGFGGSVMTCRLAEKGYRVCLLERGREYGFNAFPRRIHELKQAFWDPRDGLDGLFEFRSHPDSDICTLTASGLGGGSLIYANVLIPMDEELFEGWPGGINRSVLEPYYQKVLGTMEAAPYPFDDDPYYADTPKTAALKDAAGRLGQDPDATAPPHGFFPHLAVWFKGTVPGEQSPNAHGVLQSRCIKCGECDIGCNIHAKNTLDLNYIARARNGALLGPQGVPADVRTNAEAVDIVPDGGGYRVTYRSSGDAAQAAHETLHAGKVVVSCGSVGSAGLLLRLKRSNSLPKLSDALGKKWCGNGDLEGTVLGAGTEIVPTKGPVITYAIKYTYRPYPDGFAHQIYVEDAGFPAFLAWYAAGKIPSGRKFVQRIKLLWKFIVRIFKRRPEINIGDDLSRMIDNDGLIRHTMLLLGMGRDRSDGEVVLDEQGDAAVKWRAAGSRLHIDRQKREMKRLAKAMDGKFLVNPLTYIDKLIAVHPLGGCAMADDPAGGVVGPNGEVFNYPGLYVVDGSILPTSIGPNPSLTIAALAERIADQFPARGGT